jgi:hypothetical protein
MRVLELMKRPAAFVPPAMSLAALATVAVHLARFGVTHEPDEGTAAHIWQLLVSAQLPVIGYFAMTWLPRATREAVTVLAIDLAAIAMAAAPVLILKL